MGKGLSPNFQPSPSALCFLPSLVRRILPRSTGLQKSLLPALWRSRHLPLLSTAKLQLVWGCMAWEVAGETGESGGGGGWLPGGSVWQRDPGSPGSCRSQTARKARKAKGGRGGTGRPLSNQRTPTFRCSYQHLALLSSLLFLPTHISMVHGWSLAFYTVSQWAWHGEFCSISYSECVSSYHWHVP